MVPCRSLCVCMWQGTVEIAGRPGLKDHVGRPTLGIPGGGVVRP